MFFLGEIWAFL